MFCREWKLLSRMPLDGAFTQVINSIALAGYSRGV